MSCANVKLKRPDAPKKGFSYVKDLLGIDLLANGPQNAAGRRYLAPLVLDDAMSHCRLSTGGNLQVMPCTTNRVNSPHEPKVTIDEAELADPEAYNEAKSIPQTDLRGNKACLRITSTRKYAWGTVQQEVDRAEDTGMTVLIWCYKETAEKCPDARSGTDPCSVWVDDDTYEWYTEDEYERLTAEQQSRLLRADVFHGCLDCFLMPSCRGDLKWSAGWYPIDDLIQMFRRTSTESWQAQWECRRPSPKGLIFSKFRRERHTLTDAEMAAELGLILELGWGENYAPFHPGWLRFWAKDWGTGTGGDPDVTLLIQRSPEGRIYILDGFVVDDLDVNDVKTWLNKNWVPVYGEPAYVYGEGGGLGTQCAQVFKSWRKDLSHDIAYRFVARFFAIEDGIEALRMYLSPPGGGEPMILINRDRCTLVPSEFERYHERLGKNDEPSGVPADEYNHSLDSIRYFVGNEMPVFRASTKVPLPTPEQAEKQRRRFPQKKVEEPMAAGFY